MFKIIFNPFMAKKSLFTENIFLGIIFANIFEQQKQAI
jgi:hypothetical protein